MLARIRVLRPFCSMVQDLRLRLPNLKLEEGADLDQIARTIEERKSEFGVNETELDILLKTNPGILNPEY